MHSTTLVLFVFALAYAGSGQLGVLASSMDSRPALLRAAIRPCRLRVVLSASLMSHRHTLPSSRGATTLFAPPAS